MSCVSNVVVHVVYVNDAVRGRLTEDLDGIHTGASGLGKLDYRIISGTKAFEDDIYAGAFNYLDADGLLAWWDGLPWAAGDRAVISCATEGEWDFVRRWRVRGED